MKKTSLYVHIPFCQKKCLFCSFVISVGQQHRVDDYLDALCFEMKQTKSVTIDTLYVGGGTPTMLNASQLKKLFDMIRGHYVLTDDVEITVEANPEGLTSDKLDALKQAGVNRLSIGVQSMHDRYLTFLGRCHDSATARVAIKRAQECGFENISVDLMYSYPGQTAEEITADVQAMVDLAPQHISLYSLTIEEQSRFYAQALTLDDPEKLAQDYALIIRMLAEQGYAQYEVSNFARSGYMSRHNRHYWLGGEYVGLGMGAHGFESGTRYWNGARLQDYLRCAQEERSPRDGEEALTPQQLLYERLVFGLRMNEGVVLAEIEHATQCTLSTEQHQAIADCIEEGLLTQHGDRLCCTSRGLFVLDDLAVKLCS